MKKGRKLVHWCALSSATVLMTGGLLISSFIVENARAECAASNRVPANQPPLEFRFPKYAFWHFSSKAMAECGNVKISLDFDSRSLTDHLEQERLKLGHAVGVSSADLDLLVSHKQLRSLDDLAEKFSGQLDEKQFIRRNGKIYAIMVAINVPVMAIHEESLVQAGINPPRDLNEMIAAGWRLRAISTSKANKKKNTEQSANLSEGQPEPAATMKFDYGLSLPFKRGWNMTYFFASLLASQGSALVNEANRPLFSSAKGRAALELMKRAAGVAPGDFVESDSVKVVEDLQAGRAPIGLFWVSSAGELDKPGKSRVLGKMKTMPIPPLKVGGTTTALYWWDGFALPENLDDKTAEKAFKVLLEGLDEEVMTKYRDLAVWTMKGAKPGRFAASALDALEQGATSYQISPARDLAYQVLAPLLESAIRGKISVKGALQKAEKDYLKVARERGLLGS